jgi:predicted metal-dependent hydrolase
MIISFIVTIIIIGFIIVYLKYFIHLRPKESGFEYVQVNDDGTVRELYNHEIEYLKTKFHPTDGDRPYIKNRYNSLTPDNKISGFIKRNRVPKKIQIKKTVHNNS